MEKQIINISLLTLQKIKIHLTDDILDTSVEATNFYIQFFLCETKKYYVKNQNYFPCNNFFYRVLNFYSISNLINLKDTHVNDIVYLKKSTLLQILRCIYNFENLQNIYYDLYQLL